MAENNEAIAKASDETHAEEKVIDSVNCTLYEKSQSLVDIANNTFKELCRTLENEQTKLLELEERRKKLQEEMQRLKMEIEEEKKTYHINVLEISGADSNSNIELNNSNASSSTSVNSIAQKAAQNESASDFIERQQADLNRICGDTMSLHQLDTCFEVDENNEEEQDITAVQAYASSHSQITIDAEEIHKQLQSVVTECIIEQCKYDKDDPTDNNSDVKFVMLEKNN